MFSKMFFRNHKYYLSTDSLQDLTLDFPHPFDHQLIPVQEILICFICEICGSPELFKEGKRTSSEEDKGVSEPVSLPAKGVLVHEGISSSLVVRAGNNLRLTQAGVSHLEIGVKHPGQYDHKMSIFLLSDQPTCWGIRACRS